MNKFIGMVGKGLAIGATAMLSLAAQAATVTGAFNPAAVGSSSVSTLRLSYANFTGGTTGMTLKLFYNASQLTPGTTTYFGSATNPVGPGQSQPTGAIAADNTGCAGTDTSFTLNWVDFGASWPNPTTGVLADVAFTTSASFTSPATVCWVQDLSGGSTDQAIGTAANNTATLLPPPTANVSALPATLTDSAGQVSTVTVTLSSAAGAGGVQVPLTITLPAGRATSNCVSPITVAQGATTATCTVTATANAVSGDGNVNASVAPNCTSSCVNGTTANIAINDDDVPTVSVTASATTLTDSAGQVSTLTFTTAIASANAISVVITPPAASARYTTTCASPITIAAQATTATCTVTAVANTDVGDGSAPAVVSIQSCSTTGATCNVGNPSAATVTVTDDDKAVISIAAAPTSIPENGGSSTVTITAAAPAGGALVAGGTVSVVLSGTGTSATSRYSTTCSSPQLITFGGANTATCTIQAIDNNVVDGDATATVSVSANAAYTVGAPSSATVTIVDDEHPVTVTAASGQINEGQTAVFNIACGNVTGTIQVSFTLTGADSGVMVPVSPLDVNCPAGGQVTVPTIDDTTIGNSRQITMTLTGVQGQAGAVLGTPASATVFVVDNDRPTVIPTLSELGLLTLLLTMVGAAGFALRRKV